MIPPIHQMQEALNESVPQRLVRMMCPKVAAHAVTVMAAQAGILAASALPVVRDNNSRVDPDFIPCVVPAFAEVGVFNIQKVSLIHSANGQERLAADQHERRGDTLHTGRARWVGQGGSMA